jgi:hypothetical protein
MIRALETNACEVLRRTAKAFSSNRFSSLNVKGVNLRPAIRASAFSFAGRIGPRPSTTAHATSGSCFVSGVLAKGGTGKPARYSHSRGPGRGTCPWQAPKARLVRILLPSSDRDQKGNANRASAKDDYRYS